VSSVTVILLLLTACVTPAGAASELTHSSSLLGTKYGTWGTTFTCETCHNIYARNIKRIIGTIPASIGTPLVKPVRFMNLTGMGNDGDAHTSSRRICEVCHTRTAVHRYDTTGQTDFDHMGANGTDCTTCHAHRDGFGASCNRCHGYPPQSANLGQDGLATPATGILASGQAGAHVTHVVDAHMVCTACHQGYTANPMGNRSIELGFRLAGDTVTGFAGTIAAGSFAGKTPAAPYAGIVATAAGTTATSSANGTNSCAVYCHGGWGRASGGLVTAPVWSGTLGGAGCNACHGASATTPPLPTVTSGAHPRHAGNGSGGLAIGCGNCHGDVSDTSHMDGRVRWDFTGLGGSAQYQPTSGSYAVAGFTFTAAPSPTYGYCATVYCHSTVQNQTNGGTDGVSYKTPQWGGSSVGCGGCHRDMGTTTGSGSHPRHTVGYGFLCATCHNGAGAGTTLHANRVINMSFSGNGTGTVYSQSGNDPGNGYGTCSAAYCHSNGTSTTGTFLTIAWGAQLACNGCHSGGIGGSTQGPTYTGGKANSHPTHGFTCDKCHAGVTNGTGAIISPSLHANKTYNLLNGGGVSFTVLTQGTPTTPTQCGSISCHGGNAATWGGAPLSCGSCHGGTADRDNFSFNDGVIALISTDEWTVTGHGNASGANFGGAATTAACLFCHASGVTHGASGNFFRLANTSFGGWGLNGACMICHAASGATGYNGKTASKKVSAYHFGAKHGNSGGGRWCWDCHDPHGDGNIKMIGGAVARTANSDGRPTVMATALFTANTTGTDYAGSGTKLCNTCHTATLHYTASTSDSHQARTKCTACHTHSPANVNEAFDADCLACHATARGKRAPVVAHFSGNSHHVQGVSLTSRHCYQCHWEANSDGTVNGSYHAGAANGVINLVVFTGTARPTSYAAGTTATEYTANGTRVQLAKINQHCMGCHNDTGKTMAQPGPFGDGKLPHSYSWDGASIAAKYGNTGTTSWGKYTGTNVTPKSGVTKAFSAHGNAIANAGGWNTAETWPNTRGGTTVDRNVYCFDCHNAHGSTVTGTTTSYTVTGAVNGGLLKDVTNGQGGYTATYKPVAGGSTATKNFFNAGAALCFDCHQTQTTSGSRPWGWSTTYGATAAILGYWDSPSFGPGTFPATSRYPFKNIGHKGGHFGASSALSSAAAKGINGLCTPCHDPHGINPTNASRAYMVPLLKGTWLTSVYKEDTAPADNRAYPGGEENTGPLPSASYTAAINSYHIDQNTLGLTTKISESDSQFAGLCLQCHPKTNLTNGTNHTWKNKNRIHESVKGWKTANTNVKHGYSCSKCHAVHNAQLPRLMVTNCFDTKHRGRLANQASPVTSGSGRGEEGSGSGRIPGKYTAKGNSNTLWGGASCHEGQDTTQKWNTITPWVK
jgi:predicted CxxxxCH...CXXCH cytochrome family protein